MCVRSWYPGDPSLRTTLHVQVHQENPPPTLQLLEAACRILSISVKQKHQLCVSRVFGRGLGELNSDVPLN
jgi:hypothetical protein